MSSENDFAWGGKNIAWGKNRFCLGSVSYRRMREPTSQCVIFHQQTKDFCLVSQSESIKFIIVNCSESQLYHNPDFNRRKMGTTQM